MCSRFRLLNHLLILLLVGVCLYSIIASLLSSIEQVRSFVECSFLCRLPAPTPSSHSLSRYRAALAALGDYAGALRLISEGGATWDLLEELSQRKEAVQLALDRAATELGDLRELFK